MSPFPLKTLKRRPPTQYDAASPAYLIVIVFACKTTIIVKRASQDKYVNVKNVPNLPPALKPVSQ